MFLAEAVAYSLHALAIALRTLSIEMGNLLSFSGKSFGFSS
jgi:hypothetical protein